MTHCLGYYADTDYDSEILRSIWCIYSEKENPNDINDLYCVITKSYNDDNQKTEFDNDNILKDIITKISNTINEAINIQSYTDEYENQNSVYKNNSYESYQISNNSNWKVDNFFSNDEREVGLANCVISGEGKSEIDALVNCINNREFIQKIASEISKDKEN